MDSKRIRKELENGTKGFEKYSKDIRKQIEKNSKRMRWELKMESKRTRKGFNRQINVHQKKMPKCFLNFPWYFRIGNRNRDFEIEMVAVTTGIFANSHHIRTTLRSPGF